VAVQDDLRSPGFSIRRESVPHFQVPVDVERALDDVLVGGRLHIRPTLIRNWSLTSLPHWLAKTGGRLVKHARYYWLLPAESLRGGVTHRYS
jgi:hypothetical protein